MNRRVFGRIVEARFKENSLIVPDYIPEIDLIGEGFTYQGDSSWQAEYSPEANQMGYAMMGQSGIPLRNNLIIESKASDVTVSALFYGNVASQHSPGLVWRNQDVDNYLFARIIFGIPGELVAYKMDAGVISQMGGGAIWSSLATTDTLLMKVILAANSTAVLAWNLTTGELLDVIFATDFLNTATKHGFGIDTSSGDNPYFFSEFKIDKSR